MHFELKLVAISNVKNGSASNDLEQHLTNNYVLYDLCVGPKEQGNVKLVQLVPVLRILSRIALKDCFCLGFGFREDQTPPIVRRIRRQHDMFLCFVQSCKGVLHSFTSRLASRRHETPGTKQRKEPKQLMASLS